MKKEIFDLNSSFLKHCSRATVLLFFMAILFCQLSSYFWGDSNEVLGKIFTGSSLLAVGFLTFYLIAILCKDKNISKIYASSLFNLVVFVLFLLSYFFLRPLFLFEFIKINFTRHFYNGFMFLIFFIMLIIVFRAAWRYTKSDISKLTLLLKTKLIVEISVLLFFFFWL